MSAVIASPDLLVGAKQSPGYLFKEGDCFVPRKRRGTRNDTM